MRALLLILVASSAFGQGRFDRTNQRTDQGRSKRGFMSSAGYAFFEFAPASGAGMSTACACTTPTGAKGEAMTFTRAGDATCSKQGLATTGIANGDLVVCTANQPRVESSGGVLGLRVEGARTNVLPRFIEFTNAAWADVGTPTLTGSQTSPFTGALASSAVQFDDNDGAAFEGRTQTVTVTAATAYTMSCYVKAGTLASWTLSLDGTTASGTGLSSTTWSLVTVADASSSGVAIAAQALNGSTAAATGTVIWGGCQVEAGTYATSSQPTVAAAVVRNAEAASFVGLSTTPRCASGSFSVPYTIADGNRRIVTASNAGGTSQIDLFVVTASGVARGFVFDGTDFVQPVTANTLTAAGTVNRAYSYFNPNSAVFVALNGGSEATSAAAAVDALATDRVAVGVVTPSPAGSELNGIVSLVQVDPSPTRCR